MTLQAALLTLVALVGGAMIALQAPINAEAATRLGNPIAAATMSFCVGTIALIAVTCSSPASHQSRRRERACRSICCIGGGLLGAMYVTITLVLAPKIGIAAVMALGIAGQLVAALLLDRFGMFDLMERGLTSGRVGGAVLVLVGALMVRLL